MDFIVLYLKEDTLPEEKSEANKMRRKAPQIWLFEDQKLYKRFFSGLYLLCIHPEALKLLLEELHERIYGSHIRDRSLLLVAEHAKGSTRICEEVQLVPKICPKYSSTKRGP